MATSVGSNTGQSIDWAAIYGSNNIAAQMLSDMPFSTYENMQVSGLANQLSTIEQEISQVEHQDSAWTTLQGDAGSVNSAFSALANSANFLGASATSTNSAVLQATADNTATPGSYTVTVNQVAAQEIDGTDSTGLSITQSTTALALGTTSVDLTIGGTAYSVAITPAMSLSSIATAINESGAPVSALVEQDSVNNTYYLSVFGDTVGQSIQYGGSTSVWSDVGILSSTGTVNQVQAAAQAEISVGTGNVYTSASDTFSNVLPGVTIQAASTGTATITVSPDSGQAVNTVKTLVSNWNQWVSDTQNLAFGTLTSVSSSGTFTRNPNQVLTSPIPMSDLNSLTQSLLNTSANGYSLADVGITFNSQDQMTVNQSTLQQALSANASGVQGFFAALASVAAPVLTDYAVGPNSVTGTSLTLGKNQLTQYEQQASAIETEVTNQQTQAQASYADWTKGLEQWAQTQEMMQVFNNQNASNSSGL